jgi:hypothetical protein
MSEGEDNDVGRAPICPFCGVTALPAETSNLLSEPGATRALQMPGRSDGRHAELVIASGRTAAAAAAARDNRAARLPRQWPLLSQGRLAAQAIVPVLLHLPLTEYSPAVGFGVAGPEGRTRR